MTRSTRLGEGIDALRAIITDLRPAALDQLGAKAALEALVERARSAPDAPEIDSARRPRLRGRSCVRPDMRPAIEDATYRLIQEALSNALKHASASRVDISVVERDGAVHIDVRDDGRGFDTDRRRRRLRAHRDARARGARGWHAGCALAARKGDRTAR